MADDLKIDRHGRVTLFTLNRPERHNALTMQLAADLESAVQEFGRDKDQRVLIITGAGEKAFCSGADLLEVRDVADAGIRLPTAPDQDMMGIGRCEKPVIAAINGLAVGAGLELAICADIRLAADTAWFGLPEVERGFLAGVAAVTLPRLMPIGAVMDLMLTGSRLAAQDACRLGLVQQVLDKGELLEAAMARAERMSRFSQSALWGTKQVIRHWRNRSLDEHHDYYRHVVGRVFSSGDVAEGLRAFAEKRAPEYDMDWPPDPAVKLP
ncbi:MAG: enoyl-CoA hydratase/isomerase family protein [Novosphingobium sp.]|jgi:enoyl-CoA hydratase/carnithine racemase|nr:enoyl-CoA hydratase/isomerase family protein [Novosphingobium sp.]